MPPISYTFASILISFTADVLYDVCGTRIYHAVRKFPYRVVHVRYLDNAYCDLCDAYHRVSHKHRTVRIHKGA